MTGWTMTNRRLLAVAAGRWTVAFARLRQAGAGIRPIHWYYAAATVLLAVAAALRFYELGQPLAHHDEALAALNSWGTLAEVVDNTRLLNSSPLLYPLLLWAVQQVDISPFSIRLIPALAGVLTVGVILLLPRFGVRRDAALLAAILAALAPAAIYEARGAREYGVDALVAALLIAGLLWYRQRGRRALLCGALLAAPLLQYGLVLFGIAVIGAGLLLPPPTRNGPAQTASSRRERIQAWLRRRSSLALPTAFFLAGCAVSYLTTLRYQLEISGTGFVRSYYYDQFYFQDEYRIIPALEFIGARLNDLVSHHLPPAVSIAVAAALAIWLLSVGVRYMVDEWGDTTAKSKVPGGQWAALALLLALALTAAVGAALLGQYPASQTRHITYLGPALFVFSGAAIAAAIQGLTQLLPARLRMRMPAAAAASPTPPRRRRRALAIAVGPATLRDDPSGPSRQVTFLRPRVFVFSGDTLGAAVRGAARILARLLPFIPTVRREQLALALALLAGAMMVGAGILAIRQDSPYRVAKAADFYGILDQSVKPDDIVYITASTVPVMSLYGNYFGQQWPDNYIQGKYGCWYSYTICISDIFGIATQRAGAVGDIWVIFHRNLSERLERYDARGTLESFEDFRNPASRITLPSLTLQRFPADGGMLARIARDLPANELRAARRLFEVDYSAGRLTYQRTPCAPADTAPEFFLHLYPAGPRSVLPEWRQRHGFDNLDFHFAEQGGTRQGNRCVVSVALPEYDIASIHTGQYDGVQAIWQTNIQAQEQAGYAATVAGKPAARSVFNLHWDGDRLLYAKSPCAPGDTADPFFLHITPVDPTVLPRTWRPHGFEGRDFRFYPRGIRRNNDCYISVTLPEYDIASIRTGQYDGVEQLWEVEFAP